MVAVMAKPTFQQISTVIDNELYRCTIDLEEKVVSVTTDLGPEMARRIAEFEAGKSDVGISLIFTDTDPSKRTYQFRLRHGGCMADEGRNEIGEDSYKELAARKEGLTVGCPHSRKGDKRTCSLCIAAAERAEIIRLVKAGKL